MCAFRSGPFSLFFCCRRCVFFVSRKVVSTGCAACFFLCVSNVHVKYAKSNESSGWRLCCPHLRYPPQAPAAYQFVLAFSWALFLVLVLHRDHVFSVRSGTLPRSLFLLFRLFSPLRSRICSALLLLLTSRTHQADARAYLFGAVAFFFILLSLCQVCAQSSAILLAPRSIHLSLMCFVQEFSHGQGRTD